MSRVLPLALLLLLGAGSLAFDLTLPLRLPSDQDWAEAAGALRASAGADSVVQIWPPWAERARLFVDAAPVRAEEDLAAADFVGAQKLWLLALPRVPFAGLSRARAALQQRGAVALGVREFGALSLEEWSLRNPPLATLLTAAGEEHEVDYVSRQCERVAIGAGFARRGAGRELHLRAGIIGERAYDAGRAPVEIRVAGLGALTVRGPGWQRLDLALPAGDERELAFEVRSADPSPPFCLQAWTTR